ncbi:hypothetical protein FSP39_006804 [Pinctada imbricata]|uniref:Sodium/calcium exchanger membrane region domain-containing protein n=1 Tax=Pinctada imbricata TaxID=66713 RepID=A0AA88Y2M6_PINIB|nr:hypothetical protein FSP39_006804 [Pinctada imbricata]
MLADAHYQRRQQFRKMAQKSSVLSYTRSIRGWFTMTIEGENVDFWKRVPSIGMGDMAVSNALGSNVFDILLGLSFPWFLKTGVAYAGTTVSINSRGMFYSIILLFLIVLILVGAFKYTHWVLNRKVGILCLVVYAIYLVFSVMIECNVFGYVNPPMCE